MSCSFPGIGAKQPYNEEIYTRKKEECQVIDVGGGEFVFELLGNDNGGAKQLSIAFVDILKGGTSQAHYHPEKEESYIILDGEGKLVIDGVTKSVSQGDIVHIPVGTVHEISTIGEKTLKFYCVCAPAWTPEGYVPAEKSERTPKEGFKIYTRKKEECTEITTDRRALIYEMLGKDNGGAKQHNITLVEISKAGSSKPTSPDTEECFIITEGKGKLEINGKEKIVIAGDVAKIPAGRMNQISTVGEEALKFYRISAMQGG